MKRLSLGSPLGADDTQWAFNALKQIEQASYEDIEGTFDDFTITGTFTETRTLNASTATLSDVVAFIATMVSDIQKRGQNRNPNEVI